MRNYRLFCQHRKFILTAWLSFILIVFNPFAVLLANTANQAAVVSNLPMRVVATNSNNMSQVLLPDWQQISFSSMPPIQESGSVELAVGDMRSWLAGQTPDQYLQLGDIDEALRPDLASLKSIAQVVGDLDFDQISLKDFPLVGQHTLKHLADIVPNLDRSPITQVRPVADLLATQNLELLGTDMTLGEVLQQFPELGKLQLKALDLSKYTINSIPQLELVQLGKFDNWQSTVINKVPGLKNLPLAYFPQPLTELGNLVARVDAVYGPAEQERLRTVSGSNQVGFSYPCQGQKCAYVELDDLENQGRELSGSFEGRSWISGKYQKVPGGRGCLKGVNGGQEPTGRHPFGKAFKVVVMEPNEKTDTINTALFFRFKNWCSATPYFIGPVPFINYKVNDPIFIGIWNEDRTVRSHIAAPASTPATPANTQSNPTTPASTPVAGSTTETKSEECTDADKAVAATLVHDIDANALAEAIAQAEDFDTTHDSIGPLVVDRSNQQQGRALGRYQIWSNAPAVVAVISQKPNGEAWLKSISEGKVPTQDELAMYFPPADQEALFRQSIVAKVETAAAEADPTTGQPYMGDRLVQRVAQMYSGGDESSIDDSNSTQHLSLLAYSLQVKRLYEQQLPAAMTKALQCNKTNSSS